MTRLAAFCPHSGLSVCDARCARVDTCGIVLVRVAPAPRLRIRRSVDSDAPHELRCRGMGNPLGCVAPGVLPRGVRSPRGVAVDLVAHPRPRSVRRSAAIESLDRGQASPRRLVGSKAEKGKGPLPADRRNDHRKSGTSTEQHHAATPGESPFVPSLPERQGDIGCGGISCVTQRQHRSITRNA